MIDRETVLHVAQLARLEFSDEEVEQLTGELASVLDHIETIARLDLDGVAPTTHVVAIENTLRADEPQPSLPVARVLADAPEVADGGFAVPSPQA
jgi:aspartyl-tRNA(Asn)/glutamyl-tRNA(Gln) amidotransferase subunit C